MGMYEQFCAVRSAGSTIGECDEDHYKDRVVDLLVIATLALIPPPGSLMLRTMKLGLGRMTVSKL